MATSDSESREEVKGNGDQSSVDKNSLSDIKLEEVAPAADVILCFFGARKNPDGSNRYNKLQIGFKSFTTLE